MDIKRITTFSTDEVVKRWYSKVEFSSKIAFLTTFLSAFFTHIYLFTRKSLNEDMLGYIQYISDHTASGRWSEHFLTSFRGNYMMPMVIGLICFVLLSFTAVMTVRLLRIRNTLNVIISSILIATFPTLAYSFGYLFMAHTYCAALFMSALSVWVTVKYRFGFLIGGVFLGLSMGAYQAYLGYAATLCIICLILDMFYEKLTANQFIKSIIRYLALGGIGGLSYFLGLKVCLSMKGIELLDYKGVNTMGQYSLDEIPGLFMKSWIRFWGFFTGKTFFQTSKFLTSLYCILIMAVFILISFQCIKYWKQKEFRLSVCMVYLLLFLLPFTINIVDLLAPESTSGTLNIYQMVLLFIFPFALIECAFYSELSDNTFSIANHVGNWVLVCVCGLLSFNYFIVSNVYSLKLETYTKRTELLNNRVFSRIEELHGFYSEMPVAVVASSSLPLYGKNDDFPDIVRDQGLWGQFVGYNYGTPKNVTNKFVYVVNNIMGTNLKAATNEQLDQVMQTSEYLRMGIWPEQSSVAVIDGIAVVKCLPSVGIDVQVDEENNTLVWSVIAEPDLLDEYTYAWYVYCNDERIEVLWYKEDQTTIFVEYSTPGEYYVAAFMQALDDTEQDIYKVSDKITISE